MSFHFGVATGLINIPPGCEMIETAGPTSIGDNQVTQIIAPEDNARGLIILSLYTQVIQSGMPGNLAQSLIVAAATAPTNFSSKPNCFPVYRTFQSDKQAPIALGGFAPVNVNAIRISSGWGVWQILNVVNAALDRNNMRFGVVFL